MGPFTKQEPSPASPSRATRILPGVARWATVLAGLLPAVLANAAGLFAILTLVALAAGAARGLAARIVTAFRGELSFAPLRRALDRTRPQDTNRALFWAATGTMLALTLDSDSPLLTMPETDPFFPLLFRHDIQAWEPDFPHFRALRWERCNALFTGTENHFTASYQQLIGHPPPSDEDEEDDTDESLAARFLVGRHIVRYRGVPCLFYCRGYSFSIRQCQATRFEVLERGEGDRRKYEELQPRLEYVQKAPAKDIDDVAFWGEFFRALTPPPGGATPT